MYHGFSCGCETKAKSLSCISLSVVDSAQLQGKGHVLREINCLHFMWLDVRKTHPRCGLSCNAKQI